MFFDKGFLNCCENQKWPFKVQPELDFQSLCHMKLSEPFYCPKNGLWTEIKKIKVHIVKPVALHGI